MPAIGSFHWRAVLRATGIAWAVVLVCAVTAGVAGAANGGTDYVPETGMIGRWFGGVVAVAMRGQYISLGVCLIGSGVMVFRRAELGERRPLSRRRDRAFVGAAILGTIVAQLGAAAWLVGGAFLDGGSAWAALNGGMTALGPVFLIAACFGAIVAGILPRSRATFGGAAVRRVRGPAGRLRDIRQS